jgi:uncharacterized membrane protein
MSLQKISWAVFIVSLLLLIAFVVSTLPGLPPLVASHFNAAGYPDALISRSHYAALTLGLGVAVPIILVALLTAVYSRASDMKLPNRDYWLAEERIARTRALLVAHGIWFGTLLVSMVCFVHWLELAAHRRVPPQLSNGWVEMGVLIFFLITSGWTILLVVAFRRPQPERVRVEPPLE